MRILVNTYGTEVKLRQEVILEPVSPGVRDVLSALRDRYRAPLERFLNADLSPVGGVAILINGRNLRSLDQSATTVQDGDELTFTVMLSGGQGSNGGALAGGLFMSFLTNGLNLVSVSTYIQGMVIGAASIGAV